MALQLSFPAAAPPDSHFVSPRLAIWKDDERIVAFSAADPVYACRRDDRDGIRLMAGMLSSLKLAPDTQLAKALGISRETVRRNRRLYEQGGSAAVRDQRGSKGPTKLTDDVCARAQRLLAEGCGIRHAAREVGVSDGALHYAIKQGRLTWRGTPTDAVPTQADPAASSPAQRAAEDQACELGVGAKRTMERVLAYAGKLQEALPEFTAAEAVQGAGVLLALPALLQQGLMDVGQSVYGSLHSGFYGLRSVLLTFCFMSLLRIKNPEQLKTRAPGELGLLLGLDRAPVVETVRRKLQEMGKRSLARLFGQRLTERWAEAEADMLGLLYFDGHVRAYNGRVHKLPKHHVQRRGRPMPGTQDFHVNNERADPLFCVTAEATESLLAIMDEQLLPEVRRLVGPKRRVTIVFDREGWSPESFKRWHEQGFDVLTYRKGKQSRWQQRFFTKRTRRVDGRKVTYRLAERRVKLSNGLAVREIRRLTEDGHQTAVITTHRKLSTFQVAHRMFNRWRQENFFRYMREEFAIDHLSTTAVELADPKRLVTNPQRSKLQKRVRTVRDSLGRLVVHRGELKPGQKARVERRTLTRHQIDKLIKDRKQEIARLKGEVEKLPKQVPLDQIQDREEIVRLEPERKLITDAFKMIAYRAESALARLIEPFFPRHQDEAHNFMKTVFQATADLIPDENTHVLTVRFHGLSNPRSTRALRTLCEIVTRTQTCYPGTDFKLRFEAPCAT